MLTLTALWAKVSFSSRILSYTLFVSETQDTSDEELWRFDKISAKKKINKFPLIKVLLKRLKWFRSKWNRKTIRKIWKYLLYVLSPFEKLHHRSLQHNLHPIYCLHYTWNCNGSIIHEFILQTYPPHYNQSYLSEKHILCKIAFKITQLALKIYKLSIFIIWLLIYSLPVSSIYSANIWVSTLCYCDIVIISLSLLTVVNKMGMSPPSWSTLLAQQTHTRQWLCPYKSDQGYERKLRHLHAKKWFCLQYEKCLKYIKTKSI